MVILNNWLINMDLSSLRPYNFHQNGLDYTFVTDFGVIYHAYFIDYSSQFPDLQNIFSFNIEPEGEPAREFDIRIQHTIVTILASFFSNNTNVMLIVCDSTDGRERQRKILFDRWYLRYHTSDIIKYDASLETEDYMLYVSLLIHSANPNLKQAVDAFYNLVRNNMYPE
jgi:hypothetical protein